MPSGTAALTEASDSGAGAGVVGFYAAWQAAVHAWVVAGSGLAADRVIWSGQNGPRPAAPWISLSITQVDAPKVDWRDVRPAASPSAGRELTASTRGVRAASLSIQAFSPAGVGLLAPTSLLEAVRLAATLPSVREALGGAGVGVADLGSVRDVGGVLGGSVFEPRAHVDVRLNLVVQLSEPMTYIGQVSINPTIDESELPEFLVPPDGAL